MSLARGKPILSSREQLPAPMGELAVARAKHDDSAIVMVNTDTSAHPSIGHLTVVVSTPLFLFKLGSAV